MRPVPEAAVDIVARWEGLRLDAYPDPATGGEPWTIGYGHTDGVRDGQTISAEHARELLLVDLGVAASAIERKIGAPIVGDLTENQYAALLSFVFNVGVGAAGRTEWTIWKRLRARRYDQIPGELIKFVNANGKKFQGLVNRRTDEIRLWSTDEPGSDVVHLTSAVTRRIATPPTPADPTPAKKSATVWAAIAAPFVFVIDWIKDALGQAPEFAQAALQAVSPFAAKSEVAAAIANGVGALGAIAGVYVAWSVLQKKKEARS